MRGATVLSKSLSDKIINFAKDHDEIDLTNDYSGRFMFGAQCWSVSGRLTAIDNFLYDLLDEVSSKEKKELRSCMKSKAIDQFGLGNIVYFPGHLLDADEEAFEEDEDY